MRTLLVLLSLAVTPLLAADPQKPAWQWTIEERLASRFDPADMRAREIADGEKQRILKAHAGMPVNFDEPIVPIYGRYVVDGCRNPAQFLPTELFDSLLLAVDPRIGRPIPDRITAHLPAKPSVFWPALERISARYVAAKKGGGKSPEELCHLRALSLAMARAEFGAEPFDRFLYEAVAPGLVRTFPRSASASALIAQERCRRE